MEQSLFCLESNTLTKMETLSRYNRLMEWRLKKKNQTKQKKPKTRHNFLMKSTRSTYKFSLKIKKILIKKIHRKITFLTLSMADFSKFKPLTLTLSLLETPLNLKTMSEMELLKILNNQSKSNSPLYKKHSTPQKSTNSLLMKI